MKLILVIVFFLFIPLAVWPQEDSVLLDQVLVIESRLQGEISGPGIRKVPITEPAANLAEALSGQTPVYFKSYGSGQLSTVSFRGTGASHTNVLWHGIPANYPTLGQMDFSQWPVWLLQDISVYPGSAGALFGSGAMGGTVLLDSEPGTQYEYEKKWLETRVEIGSFGKQFYGGKVFYGEKMWAGSSRLFLSAVENDFPYELGRRKVRQANAAVLNYGFQQQFRVESGMNQFLADVMWTYNDREIQPNKYNQAGDDELQTENARVALTYRRLAGWGTLEAVIAYLQNDQLYNRLERTRSDQYSALMSCEHQFGEYLKGRVGMNLNYFLADVDSYTRTPSDLQSAFVGSLEFSPFRWWQVTFDARQSAYRDYFPFTPAVIQHLRLLKYGNSLLRATQKVAWGFRYPTLNDLYWEPGGNPQLQPERSRSVEASLEWLTVKEQVSSEVSVNVYQMISRDWITWQPQGSFWSPENLNDVQITGVEAHWEMEVSVNDFVHRVQVSGAWVKATDRSDEYKDNQLPYTPAYTGKFNLRNQYRTWSMATRLEYVSRRYTTLDNDPFLSVPQYAVINVHLDKEFQDLQMHVGFGLLNLLDAGYENVINRAMPGRNFECYVSFQL